MLQIGDIHIHLINDGTILIDPGGPFGLVPRALWSRVVDPVNDYFVANTLTCLLVQADGKNIVVDTGYGHKDDEKLKRNISLSRENGDLLAGLARLGVQPEDVDLVIDTHLHGDHAGGNTYIDDNGDIQPTFPNAEYVVQRREYEDAMQPNERTRATYFPVNYAPLVQSGQMRLLDGDAEFLRGIKGVVTPGHTPGHMSVLFERDGQHAMFVCDMATMAVNFEKLAWMTAYDVEPLITLETKRLWQQWALDTNALLIFPHDPDRRVCRLTEQDGKRKLVTLNEPFA